MHDKECYCTLCLPLFSRAEKPELPPFLRSASVGLEEEVSDCPFFKEFSSVYVDKKSRS